MDKNTYANLPGVTDWKWRFVFAWVFAMVGLMSLISIMIFGNWMRTKSFLALQLLFPMQLKCGLTKREMFRDQKVAF